MRRPRVDHPALSPWTAALLGALASAAALLLGAWAALVFARRSPPPRPTAAACPRAIMLVAQPATPQQQQQQPHQLLPPAPVHGPITVAVDRNAQSPPETLRQVGYLTQPGAQPTARVLPLYGAPSRARRGRWYYYTIEPDSQAAVKLPVHYARRDCMGEVGCDELSDGDEGVTVPALTGAEPWRAAIYATNFTRA